MIKPIKLIVDYASLYTRLIVYKTKLIKSCSSKQFIIDDIRQRIERVA